MFQSKDRTFNIWNFFYICHEFNSDSVYTISVYKIYSNSIGLFETLIPKFLSHNNDSGYSKSICIKVWQIQFNLKYFFENKIYIANFFLTRKIVKKKIMVVLSQGT